MAIIKKTIKKITADKDEEQLEPSTSADDENVKWHSIFETQFVGS